MTTTAPTVRVHVLTVACPTCEARPTFRCTSLRSGASTTPHKARVDSPARVVPASA